MENNLNRETEAHGLPKIPSLVKQTSSNEVANFDKYQENEEVQLHNYSVSINIPSACEEVQLHDTVRIIYDGETTLDGVPILSSQSTTTGSNPPLPSESMPNGSVHLEAATTVNFTNHENCKSFRDESIEFSRTWSNKLEGQVPVLGDKIPTQSGEENKNLSNTDKPLPVDLFLEELHVPQLETPKNSTEDLELPVDKQWPFLLRFPISSFGICLGLSGQTILWKTLATSPSTKFLDISLKINFTLWFISIALVATSFTIYFFKIVFYFEAVRREYQHPVRVNFFFAPWLALLFLALGLPPSVAEELPHAVWYILMVPLFCLKLKIYGQWILGDKRMLSKVANPTNLLSIVGNFVGALLGASMGLKEGPIFFFSIGLAHYMVLFVTLYQMLPTNKTIPRDLHPVFFLFVAPPSVAAIAWAKIHGSFSYGSRIFYFTAMFIYLSLAVRVNLFRGFKFSISWWAYTFPMTAAAIATISYANEVKNVFTKFLSVTLSLIAAFTVTAMLVRTIVHAFVRRDLFPNDLVISTSERKRKPRRKCFPLKLGSHDHAKKTENNLKFVNVDRSDVV